MTTTIDQALPSVANAPRALPNLRATRVEDYPHIQRLESAHGLLTLSPQDWRAICVENPVRERIGKDCPPGWVLEDASGKIVGSLGNVPTTYTFRGQELLAATGRAWVVEPEYRGVALWLMDEYFNQNADLFINTTVNALAVDPFTAFGSARVPVGDWESAAYWVTSFRGFARTALRIKRWPMPGILAIPTAVALRVKDTITTKAPPAPDRSVTIQYLADFDERFDAFWNELVRQNPNKLLCVRDRSTLAWHFAGPLRSGQLWILTACRGDLLRAYAIFKRQDHPPSGLIRMRLVDYQNLDEVDHLPGLVSVALHRASAEKIHTLEHVGCDLPKMRAFDAFAPYRRKLPSWPYYYKAADASIDAALRDASVWDPSSFDGDASL